MCACKGQRPTLVFSSIASPPGHLWWIRLRNRTLIDWLRLAGQQAQKSSWFYLPSPRITDIHWWFGFSLGCWGFELRHPCLCYRHIADWIISLPPNFYNIMNINYNYEYYLFFEVYMPNSALNKLESTKGDWVPPTFVASQPTTSDTLGI